LTGLPSSVPGLKSHSLAMMLMADSSPDIFPMVCENAGKQI
jgi:hypothetical protein